MARRIDPRIFNHVIDANVLDRSGDDHDEAVDEMLRLWRGGEISLVLPYSLKAEIERPNTPPEVKARAQGFSYTLPVRHTPSEIDLHRRARDLIRGNAKPGRHDADAFHLVEAAKHGGGFFVTRDKRLRKKREEIWVLLQIDVVSPAEFMAIYRQFETGRR